MFPPWKIEGHLALLHAPQLQARVDLSRPAGGLQGASVQQQSWPPMHLLCVATQSGDLPDEPTESYVRGADVVATYAETPVRPIRPQIYWRYVEDVVAGTRCAGVELIVSAQTSRLGVDVELNISSLLEACKPIVQCDSSEPLPSGERPLHIERPRMVLFRLPGEMFTYAEMIFPGDISRSLIADAGDSLTSLQHTLCVPGLEKGVIRRARLRGLFLPRLGDLDAADEAYAHFVNSAPPLTT